jgi:hypothetical protein
MLNRLLCTTCVLAAAASAVHAEQYTLSFEDLLPNSTAPYDAANIVPSNYAPAELVGSGITVQFSTTGGTVEGAAPGVFYGDPISPTNDHSPIGVGAAVFSTATVVLTFNQPVYVPSVWVDIYAANGATAASFAASRFVDISGYTNVSDPTPAIVTSAATPAHSEPWRSGSDELVWREVISLGQTPVTKLSFAAVGFAQIDDLTISTTPVAEILHGDYNRDGSVNDADYTIWADTYDIWTNPANIGLPYDVFGTLNHGVDLRADGNLNGFVDDGDYTIWADTYGAGTPPISVVPEPVSASLIAIGGLVALRRRRTH